MNSDWLKLESLLDIPQKKKKPNKLNQIDI